MATIQDISIDDEKKKISFICSCVDPIQEIITMAMEKTNTDCRFFDFVEDGTVWRRGVLKTPRYGYDSKSFKTMKDACIPEWRYRMSV